MGANLFCCGRQGHYVADCPFNIKDKEEIAHIIGKIGNEHQDSCEKEPGRIGREI